MTRTDPRRFDRQESQPPQAEGIDKVSIYQALLRIFVHLEQKDYTQKHLRQADVWTHDDPPDPASDRDISRG